LRGDFQAVAPIGRGLGPGGAVFGLQFRDGGQGELGGGGKGDVGALGQGQFEPAGAPGIAGAGLTAGLFDGMRNIFAPFGLGMIDAVIGEDVELTVGGGGEGEPGFFIQRPGVAGEMEIGAAVAFGLAVKAAVLDIHADGEADIGLGGQLFAVGLRFAGAMEMEDGGVAAGEHVGGQFDLHGAAGRRAARPRRRRGWGDGAGRGSHRH